MPRPGGFGWVGRVPEVRKRGPERRPETRSLYFSFQNRKTMCYAAGVAESGGLDRMTKGIGSRSGVLGSPPGRVYLGVLHTTAKEEL